MVVEPKRLFQGSMSLEDFHTKALRLVKEAEYPEGDTCNRILRDTLLNALASDKICAKIIKEGNDVTLPRVMEIARLEVSTQGNIDILNAEHSQGQLCSVWKGIKERKTENLVENSIVQQILAAVETHPSPVDRVKKFHYLLTFAAGVIKAGTKKDNLVKH